MDVQWESHWRWTTGINWIHLQHDAFYSWNALFRSSDWHLQEEIEHLKCDSFMKNGCSTTRRFHGKLLGQLRVWKISSSDRQVHLANYSRSSKATKILVNQSKLLFKCSLPRWVSVLKRQKKCQISVCFINFWFPLRQTDRQRNVQLLFHPVSTKSVCNIHLADTLIL